jgi:hypothetical protein
MGIEKPGEFVRGFSQSRCCITLFDMELPDQVCPVLLVYDRRSSLQGRLSIDNPWQRIAIDTHEFGGILSFVAALRHDDCDSLSGAGSIRAHRSRLAD